MLCLTLASPPNQLKRPRDRLNLTLNWFAAAASESRQSGESALHNCSCRACLYTSSSRSLDMLKQVRVSQGALAIALNRRIGTGDRGLSAQTQHPEPRTQNAGGCSQHGRHIHRLKQMFAHGWYGCYAPIDIPN
eukprot:jgi/Chrzof1/5621/Cz16g09080.t1